MVKKLNKYKTNNFQKAMDFILFNKYRYSVNHTDVTFDLVNYSYYTSYFNNIDSLIDNALNAYRYNNYNIALEYIEKYLVNNPGNAKVWSFKAYILYKLEFYDDALYCCDVSLEIDDFFEFSWLTKAFVLIMLNRKKDALLCFDEYLTLNSNYNSLEGLKQYLDSIFKSNIKSINFDPNKYYDFEDGYDNKIDKIEDLLSNDSLIKIKNSNLTIDEYNEILEKIRITSDSVREKLIHDNFIMVESLSTFDKILLYGKSFTRIEFKPYIEATGVYSLNKIVIDDREFISNQISTLIHELSHHILAEILEQILMKLLNCQKSLDIEIVVAHILNLDREIRLMDEYIAHTVEGRFIPYGNQNYGSYEKIKNSEFDVKYEKDVINVIINFGNSLSEDIYKLFEYYIDENLRENIKQQFINDNNQNARNPLEISKTLNDEEKIFFINKIIKDNFENCIRNRNNIIRDYKLFKEKQ